MELPDMALKISENIATIKVYVTIKLNAAWKHFQAEIYQFIDVYLPPLFDLKETILTKISISWLGASVAILLTPLFSILTPCIHDTLYTPMLLFNYIDNPTSIRSWICGVVIVLSFNSVSEMHTVIKTENDYVVGMVETGKKTTSGLRLALSVKKHSASLRLFRPGNKKCKHGPIFRWITGSSRGVKNMPVSRNKISYVIVQFDQRGVVDNVLLLVDQTFDLLFSIKELIHLKITITELKKEKSGTCLDIINPIQKNLRFHIVLKWFGNLAVASKYSIYSVRELFHSLHELHSFSENIYIISYMEMSEKDGFAYKYTSLSETVISDCVSVKCNFHPFQIAMGDSPSISHASASGRPVVTHHSALKVYLICYL
ncbi:hypothetical protein HUJ04_004634 [Dendroctonus ponderosae]|nr:hypothetical protein HUJ04_004634 [Dendroctonus ponderosae]